MGAPDIFVKQVGSAEADRPFIVAPGEQNPQDVSPDGKWLMYSADNTSGTGSDLYLAPIDSDPTRTPFVRTSFTAIDARFSPDGRSVAYASNESGDFQVYVKPFPGPGPSRQVSTKGGAGPVWSRDGAQLYFFNSTRVYAADIRAPDAEPRLLFETDRRFNTMDLAPDGTSFLMTTIDDLAMQTPTRVVVNWPGLLKDGKR